MSLDLFLSTNKVVQQASASKYAKFRPAWHQQLVLWDSLDKPEDLDDIGTDNRNVFLEQAWWNILLFNNTGDNFTTSL